MGTVVDSGRFVLGEQVASFESEFASFSGAADAIGVASGTDAIEVALRGLGIGRGDEVVTQANTCVPTVAAIVRTGATPVLCDVEPDTALLDPRSLEGSLSARTRAIVPVHLYGQICEMQPIRKLAESVGAVIVEDCAQAVGAKLRGRHAGTIGNAGAFSFYPTKNLGGLGDGGAVIADDPKLSERVRMLRVYGAGAVGHPLAGVNSRLDELQAAILRLRLERLADGNLRRLEIADHYTSTLADTGARPLTRLADRQHVFHLFVVRVRDRDRYREALAERGIGTLVHFPFAVHQLSAYSELAAGPVSLAFSEQLCGQIVSLPLYPELSDAEVEYVASTAATLAS